MWFYKSVGMAVLMFSSVISGTLLFFCKICRRPRTGGGVHQRVSTWRRDVAAIVHFARADGYP